MQLNDRLYAGPGKVGHTLWCLRIAAWLYRLGLALLPLRQRQEIQDVLLDE